MNGRSTEKKAAGTFTKPSGLRPPLKAPGKPPLNYLNHSNTKTADGDKKGKPSSSRLANASQNVNQAKTPVRSKAAVKSKPKIAPSVSAKVQEDAEHSIRQKRILEWRERFKQMRFYFDGIDPALALKFRTQIKSLDGTVDQYLSYNVTHLVTGNPDAVDVSKHVDTVKRLLIQTGMSGPDVMFIAKSLDTSLWTTNRLENVLDAVCNPNALQEALHQERMLGANPSRKEVSNFKSFPGYYLLVEEPSGAYKPVAVKDYDLKYDKENPPWPKLRLHNHSSQTVFARKSHTNEEEEDSTDHISEDEENELPKEQGQAAGDVAASGFFSGSVIQAVQRKLSANPVLAKMAMRVTKDNGKRQRDENDEEVVQARPKRSKKYHVYPMIFQKAGYCENCNAKYDDYATHIRSSRHRKYAINPSNFAILDPIIKSTRRPLVQKSDSEDSDQSSEESDEENSESESDDDMKAQKVESESENTADEDESSCSEPEMVEETDNQDSEGVEDQVEVLRTSSVKEAHTDINAIQMIPHNGELNKAKPKPANTEPAICEESSESNLTSIENVANSYFGLKLNESELSVTPQGSEISDSEAKNVDSPIDKSENSDSEDILTTSKFRMPPKQATPAKKAVDGHNCKSSQNCDEDLDIEKLPSALDHAPVLIDKTNADHIVVVISKLDKSSHEYQVVFDSGENAWVTVDHNNLPQIFQQYDQENYPRNHPEQLVAKQLMSTGSNLSSIPSVIESDSDSD